MRRHRIAKPPCVLSCGIARVRAAKSSEDGPPRFPWPRRCSPPLRVGEYCSPLPRQQKASCLMWLTLAIVLLVLWGLGLATSYTLGGLIHALLVLAVVVFLVRMVQGRGAGV
jgi:hypothetical protein